MKVKKEFIDDEIKRKMRRAVRLWRRLVNDKDFAQKHPELHLWENCIRYAFDEDPINDICLI